MDPKKFRPKKRSLNIYIININIYMFVCMYIFGKFYKISKNFSYPDIYIYIYKLHLIINVSNI